MPCFQLFSLFLQALVCAYFQDHFSVFRDTLLQDQLTPSSLHFGHCDHLLDFQVLILMLS